jgi:hypothetical protein
MVLSDSTFLVTTDHGRIVYSVQPHQLIDRPGSTLRERAMDYGTPLAVFNRGQWYRSNSNWEEITDARTIALLERVPQA